MKKLCFLDLRVSRNRGPVQVTGMRLYEDLRFRVSRALKDCLRYSEKIPHGCLSEHFLFVGAFVSSILHTCDRIKKGTPGHRLDDP